MKFVEYPKPCLDNLFTADSLLYSSCKTSLIFIRNIDLYFSFTPQQQQRKRKVEWRKTKINCVERGSKQARKQAAAAA